MRRQLEEADDRNGILCEACCKLPAIAACPYVPLTPGAAIMADNWTVRTLLLWLLRPLNLKCCLNVLPAEYILLCTMQPCDRGHCTGYNWLAINIKHYTTKSNVDYIVLTVKIPLTLSRFFSKTNSFFPHRRCHRSACSTVHIANRFQLEMCKNRHPPKGPLLKLQKVRGRQRRKKRS